jgi:hypothetical protein
MAPKVCLPNIHDDTLKEARHPRTNDKSINSTNNVKETSPTFSKKSSGNFSLLYVIRE